MASGIEEVNDEDEEDDDDLEVAHLSASQPIVTPPLLEEPRGRSRRPVLRRSSRSASTGGSPLVGGLPYTGRPFCKYN